MARAQQFIDALQRRAAVGEPESVKEYWNRQREEWLKDLQDLNRQITDWLRAAVDAGGAHVASVSFSTTEPDLGTYMAPGLRVELLVDPPVVVELRPRGCRVIGVVDTHGDRVVGAHGRVDLERGADRRILLRFKREDAVTWTSFSGGRKQDLNEELFFDLLAQVADIKIE